MYVSAVGAELCELCVRACVCLCANSCVLKLFCIYLAAQVSSCVGTATLCSHL